MDIPNINKRKIEKLLTEGKRLDERGVFDFRDIEIETEISKKAEGSSRVRLGKTEVIVGVKLDTQTPYTDHEDEGTMVTSMEFSPASGERHENGPPKMDSIEIARVVDRGIRESGFIDWKKLCIKENEKVWSIMIDIYCINDDGNVLDASAIGALVALKTARFPVFDSEKEKVKYGELTDEKLPLTDKLPITMSFYKTGESLIVDPRREEEDTSVARMTIAISLSEKKEKMINSMQKGGINPISGEELETIANESEKIYEHLFKIIDQKIKDAIK